MGGKRAFSCAARSLEAPQLLFCLAMVTMVLFTPLLLFGVGMSEFLKALQAQSQTQSSAPPAPRAVSLNDLIDLLNTLAPAALLVVQEQVNRMAPNKTLMDFNVETELINQYIKAQGLMADTLASEDTPASQQAQTVNSCMAVLTGIAKLQNDVHSSERVKRLEAVFISTLKALPNAEDALEIYRTNLLELGGQ